MYLDRDLYARDQIFVVINAVDEDHLNYQFNRNKELLHAHFDQFNNRTNRFLFKDSQEDEENKLKTDFSWNIKVPWGWEVLKRDGKKNLFWMGAEYPYRWLSVHWEEGNIITDQLLVGEKLWKSSENHFESISFNEFKFNLEKFILIDFQAGDALEFGPLLIPLKQKVVLFNLLYFMIINLIEHFTSIL